MLDRDVFDELIRQYNDIHDYRVKIDPEYAEKCRIMDIESKKFSKFLRKKRLVK